MKLDWKLYEIMIFKRLEGEGLYQKVRNRHLHHLSLEEYDLRNRKFVVLSILSIWIWYKETVVTESSRLGRITSRWLLNLPTTEIAFEEVPEVVQ